ncbi:MAG: AraC family transcriptional regulator [Parafilimonas sp.]
MKPISTSISYLLKSSVAAIERDEPYFSPVFHSHPEFELVYVKEGFGKRIIGDKVDAFKKDELILIGPNVPHVWMSDKTVADDELKRCKATVVYFNPNIFSDLFYSMEETRQLKKLFAQASQGVEITGEAKQQAIQKLEKIINATGIEKIVCLLDILNTIATDNSFNCLNQKVAANQIQPSGKLTYIFDYVNANIKKNIALKDVAKVANLTPESFCRFFKQKTGKRFVDYLHETRLASARQLLLSTDLTIAEVAYKTGFKTASNFNLRFKKNTGFSPTSYRKADGYKVIY